MPHPHASSRHKAGEKLCKHCKSSLPACETWPGHKYLYCEDPACRTAAQVEPHRQYVFAETLRCTAPGCSNFVPEGSYDPRSMSSLVCSGACYYRRRRSTSLVTRICAYCGKDFLGWMYSSGLHFCSREHLARFTIEETLKRCGTFQPLISEYLDGFAKIHYRTQRYVQSALVCFCEFLIDEGISDMEQVSPKTITRFLAWGPENGRSAKEHVAYIATFMKWLIVEERRKAANPVVPEMHYTPAPRRQPRPFEEDQMQFIWHILEQRGTPFTRLVMALGEESGIRIGEMARIRLQDVETAKQRVFIGLPNKNSRERYAFFHDKTLKYLKEWLAVRRPDCGHELLLHNTLGSPSTVETIHDAMCSVLLKSPKNGNNVHEEGMDSWSTHRLRHTMATRLASNGANASTVMAAGGWVTAQAMSGYARVNDTAARRGYDEAMERVRSNKEPAIRSLSFSDYIQQFRPAA